MSLKNIIDYLQQPVNIDRIILKLLGKKVPDEELESTLDDNIETTPIDKSQTLKTKEAADSRGEDSSMVENISKVKETSEVDNDKIEEAEVTAAEVQEEQVKEVAEVEIVNSMSDTVEKMPNKFEEYAAQSEEPVDTEINLNQTVFHSKSFEEIERDILNNGENFQDEFKESYKQVEYKFLRKKRGSHIIIKKDIDE
ncbi:hypothetical protein DID75_01000 [Candidatus Marinamargulisbacteria bacterium SCGC AG-410-N11]|nr:hypothetical protein DID75_01000 [Candidatus Marinamargulisbacteria bacterium SCGC AG-410-N11]